jgi:hypothetical protein
VSPIVDRDPTPAAAPGATLREVAERLAGIDRTPCSEGEREAAVWLASRLRAAGVADVALEDEPSWGTFHPQVTALGAAGVLSSLLAIAGRRRAALAGAALTMAGILDEAQNGPRVLRRLVRRRRTTVNLVARAGAQDASRTLVVLAHHDAAQTGRFYDQSLMVAVYRRWPALLAEAKTQLPQWWLGFAAPLGAITSVAARRRAPAIAGTVLGLLSTVAVADMWRSPTVPGANDNLSAVAVLVALAELLRERPVRDLRVLLVSCGAEETLQDGIRAFMASHAGELDPATTWVLNLDSVGSPHLIMVEAEGPFWMEEYTDPSFRDLVADVAHDRGVALERGFRARASTDSVIPSRAGLPTALLGSITDWRAPANYHLMSDVPGNLDYDTIADATVVAYGVAERLANVG